jgi:DNA replication protein DnaC
MRFSSFFQIFVSHPENWETRVDRRAGGRGAGLLVVLSSTTAEPGQQTLRFWPVYKPCLQCRLERLGVLPNDAICSFENFVIDTPDLQQIVESCRTFAAEPKGLLLLLGGNGAGKTHLSVAILRELLRSNTTGLSFIKHRTFISQHRTAVRPVSFGTASLVSPLPSCQSAALLVYDDLTATVDAGTVGEDLLMDLFETRIGSLKPTIITSNLSPDDLETVLGSRLYDRFRQAAYEVIEFGFPSKRQSFNKAYLKRNRPV